MPFKRVAEAIEEMKKGNMVIMMDDEDRENEGDLVYASTFSTPEKVNFMATYAKGLICVTVTGETAKRLDLTPMVRKNNSQHETAFTVSVDSKNSTTGISAYERDETIRFLADPLTTTADFVRPGHIFPLVAKDGGVLERVGHTEGATDLCRLAGLQPCGVICEIMKDDGTMARRDDLMIFAEKHNLKIIYISDLVEYRMARETLVTKHNEGERTILGKNAAFTTFSDHLGRLHTAYIFQPLQENTAVKFHILGNEWDLLHSSSRLGGLMDAVSYLSQNGGVLLLLDTARIGNEPAKDYGIGAQILRALGVKTLKVLSSHTDQSFYGLGGFGLELTEIIDLTLKGE